MTGRRRSRSAGQISRDRKLISLFATVLLVAGGSLGMHLAYGRGPVDTVEHAVPVGSDERLTIQFTGDVMLGDRLPDIADDLGYDWPLAGVAPLLDADHVIVNAEAPFTTQWEPYNRTKLFSYTVDPAAAHALARAGVDTVGFANNHVMDSGPAGLADSLTHAAAAGLTAFGAGPNLAQAERPLLLRSPLGDVGVVGLGENFGRPAKADLAAPGLVYFSHETVQRGLDLARNAGADWVIAYVHWGDNYLQVNDSQRYWARVLVEAGYDMVIGAGSHIAQPVEFIDGVPVFYGLGNFVFGSRGRFESFGVPGYGLAVTVGITRNAPATLSVRCVVSDNTIVNYQPIPCTPEQAKTVLPAYHPRLTVWGNVGWMSCGCLIRPRG